MTSASQLPAEAVAAIERGQKIEAIRITRQTLGLELEQAKAAVERHQRAQPPALDDKRGERVPSAGGPVERAGGAPGARLFVVLVVLAAGAVAALLVL